jgi:hypothetical protein
MQHTIGDTQAHTDSDEDHTFNYIYQSNITQSVSFQPINHSHLTQSLSINYYTKPNSYLTQRAYQSTMRNKILPLDK